MTKHELVNKLASAYTHLRMADTLCGSSRVIDEIRYATNIIKDVGDEIGVGLKDKQEVL
jgi:hypothetical protein